MRWRLQQVADKKLDEDFIVIQEKANIHRKDYEKRRLALGATGKRGGSLYRWDRAKEVEETDDGPELSIIIKGEPLFFKSNNVICK